MGRQHAVAVHPLRFNQQEIGRRFLKDIAKNKPGIRCHQTQIHLRGDLSKLFGDFIQRLSLRLAPATFGGREGIVCSKDRELGGLQGAQRLLGSTPTRRVCIEQKTSTQRLSTLLLRVGNQQQIAWRAAEQLPHDRSGEIPVVLRVRDRASNKKIELLGCRSVHQCLDRRSPFTPVDLDILPPHVLKHLAESGDLIARHRPGMEHAQPRIESTSHPVRFHDNSTEAG